MVGEKRGMMVWCVECGGVEVVGREGGNDACHVD